MILQYLQDEGYTASSMTIQDETNVKLLEQVSQRAHVKRMRRAILDGDWLEVEKLCAKSGFANVKNFQYAAYRTQYLELIEGQEYQKAFTHLTKRLKARPPVCLPPPAVPVPSLSCRRRCAGSRSSHMRRRPPTSRTSATCSPASLCRRCCATGTASLRRASSWQSSIARRVTSSWQARPTTSGRCRRVRSRCRRAGCSGYSSRRWPTRSSSATTTPRRAPTCRRTAWCPYCAHTVPTPCPRCAHTVAHIV